MVLFPILLLFNTLGKAVEDGLSAWTFIIYVSNLVRVLFLYLQLEPTLVIVILC